MVQKRIQSSGNFRKGAKYNKHKVSRELLILSQIKRQPLNIGMLCAFTNSNKKTVQQMLTHLRRKGHHISLNGDMFYEYVGFLK